MAIRIRGGVRLILGWIGGSLARTKKTQYGGGFRTDDNIPTKDMKRHVGLENSFSGLPFFGIGFSSHR